MVHQLPHPGHEIINPFPARAEDRFAHPNRGRLSGLFGDGEGHLIKLEIFGEGGGHGQVGNVGLEEVIAAHRRVTGIHGDAFSRERPAKDLMPDAEEIRVNLEDIAVKAAARVAQVPFEQGQAGNLAEAFFEVICHPFRKCDASFIIMVLGDELAIKLDICWGSGLPPLFRWIPSLGERFIFLNGLNDRN